MTEKTSPPSRHRRSVMLATAGITVLAACGFGVTAANAATPLTSASASTAVTTSGVTAATSTPKPTTTAHGTPAHHRRAREDTVRTELRAAFAGGSNVGDKGQVVATLLIDNHPKAFAALPSTLKSDLTTLKNDAEAQRAGDVATIEKTALDGGYGTKIETLAKKIQANVAASKKKS